jgi:diguanylate cyclase (GGDEF)-like protein
MLAGYEEGMFGGVVWDKGTVKSLVVPGGVLLAIAIILLQAGWLPVSAPVVRFYYLGSFAAAAILAWRFHSGRILFALLTMFLAHRAVHFFSAGPVLPSTPGHIALEAAALLVPLNFVILSLSEERGVSPPVILPHLGLLFLESVFVAVICRPDQTTGPAFLHPAFLGADWWHLRVPPFGLLFFLAALGVLFTRLLLFRKATEGGLLWSLAAILFALEKAAVGPVPTAYMATGALILAGSIIENSYALAYHDELTTLPARRAFNDALLRLQAPYTLAVVDIDHFKRFNDTYGHEVGDHVLRMVASQLARVGGGGESFRVGGEEFLILFPGKKLRETAPHLEMLRIAIQDSAFSVRGGSDRRRVARPGERRRPSRGKRSQPRRAAGADLRLSVTVSIGAAEPTDRNREVVQVIRSADKALYRAKGNGRNQVVVGAGGRSRAGEQDKR